MERDNDLTITTETEYVNQPELQSLGKLFQQARKKLRYRPEDVARQLNLNTSFIEEIEADDYSKAPARVFLRGYIKAYAKLVHLPENQVLYLFEQLDITEQPSAVPALPLARTKKIGLERMAPWISLLFLAVIVIFVFLWWRNQPSYHSWSIRHIEKVITPSAAQAQPLKSKQTQTQAQASSNILEQHDIAGALGESASPTMPNDTSNNSVPMQLNNSVGINNTNPRSQTPNATDSQSAQPQVSDGSNMNTNNAAVNSGISNSAKIAPPFSS